MSITKYTKILLITLLAGLINTTYAQVTFGLAKMGIPGNATDSTGFDAGATRIGDKLAEIGKSSEVGKSQDTVPDGLTGSAWKGIRQAYEQHRHAVVAVDGEYRAKNPGQQWLTHFDGRGFVVKPDAADWRWGLQLQSYGFPGHQRSVSGQAKITTKDGRVTYDWDKGLSEWFVNGRSGLEHGFTLDSRPPSSHMKGADNSQPGSGDPQLGTGERLELRLAVRGNLRAKGNSDGQGVSFVNQQGSTVVNYAGLKVWDADNKVLPARIDANVKGLRLTVDECRARYPLTIDPSPNRPTSRPRTQV